MSLTLAGATLGAGLAAGGGALLSSVFNQWFNQGLTQKSWERDDTAVSRRVRDLERAGLSPTLAAGSSAGNTAPIPSSLDIGSPIEKAMAGMQMKANIESTQAGTELAKSQATSEIWKQQLMQNQINKMVAETTGIDLANKMYNMDMLSKIDLRNKQANNLVEATKLLQADTLFKQVSLDKLKTDLDIAKIQREVANRDLSLYTIQKINELAPNDRIFGSIFKGATSFGAGLQSVINGFDSNKPHNTYDNSWYWDNH